MEKDTVEKKVFLIRRSKKSSIFPIIIGSIIMFLGFIFLYANSLQSDDFCKWTGLIATGLGIITVLLAMNTLNKPLIWAHKLGVTFHIAIFGRPVFIPWIGIQEVTMEEKGSVSELRGNYWWFAPKEYYKTECLIFAFTNEYLKKLPLLLKGVYLKIGNKIYFPSGELSVPINNALKVLHALQNMSNVDDLTECEHKEPNVVPIKTTGTVSSWAIALQGLTGEVPPFYKQTTPENKRGRLCRKPDEFIMNQRVTMFAREGITGATFLKRMRLRLNFCLSYRITKIAWA